MAAFLGGSPAWLAAQRWLMGTVLADLAVRVADRGTALNLRRCYSAADPPAHGGPMFHLAEFDVR